MTGSPNNEKLDCLRLIRSENIGPVTFRQLMAHCGSATEALQALPELARRGGRKSAFRICSRAEAEREMETIGKIGARLVTLNEPDYPSPLRAIEDAPPVLTLLGHPHLLAHPAVAIVGARNASANGRKFARMLSRELSESGLAVVSGMARGIDASAHEGALEKGTLAVMAGGVDIVYPKENSELYEKIVAQGLALAEEPCGTIPQARHFPRRNRIVSGLSLGVVVVEAALRSGSLITARLALEQGREVMAVPGSPLDPRAQGSNALIRDGALLVESAKNIIEALKPQMAAPLKEPEVPDFSQKKGLSADPGALDQARAMVREMLSPSPVSVDELIRQCQLSAAAVVTAILEMELAGTIVRHPGNRVSAA